MISLRSVVPNVSGPSPRHRSHIEGMQKPIAKAVRNYVVIVTNPGGWESVYLEFRTDSVGMAESKAISFLKRTWREDWEIELVIEGEAAA